MSEKTKIVVIGAGPGGYVAAIKAAQLGADVTIIDKNKLGGTCLNVGCIPTKSLLHTGKIYRQLAKDNRLGIKTDNLYFDWEQIQKNKEATVDRLVMGVEMLLRKNKVKIIKGTARIAGKEVVVDTLDEKISFDKLILATGSKAFFPDIDGFNEDCLGSTDALALNEVPESLVIVGGGVIAFEFANIFNNFGSKVTMLKRSPIFLPTMDNELATDLKNELVKDGISINVNSFVEKIEKDGASNLVYANINGKSELIKADKILIAAGRISVYDEDNLSENGIKTQNGKILVDDNLLTTNKDIYAIGDAVTFNMLAHVASAMGETAAANAMGANIIFDDKSAAQCVYTNLEYASVGYTEEYLIENNISYKKGIFPMIANAKSLIENGGKGKIKILIAEDDKVLGVHILAAHATELIAEASLMLDVDANFDQVVNTIHAHPTISEAMREAMLATKNMTINI